MGKLDYRTLRENVADEIRMKILNGDMKPGDKIIEQELASEFGISRGPVREALRQLEQEGMVEYSRNVGCSVKHIGMDDVYEIYYMRANYEMMAVGLYNAPFPQETIEKMEQVLEQMKQLHKEEYRKVFELDN
ncbi:MAG: GntR family transcriptional regulator, partial [Clostridium sp.]